MPESFKIAEAYVEFTTKGDVKKEAAESRDAFKEAQRKSMEALRNADREDRRIGREKRQRVEAMEQRRRQIEEAEKADAKSKRDREREEKQRVREVRLERAAAIQLAGRALGGIPFAGGAADIATAYVLNGRKAAAAQGAANFVGYGMVGAAKASPHEYELLQYQSDRLQAIIGREFVPAVEGASWAMRQIGDLLGGKGAQLNHPQFSAFADIRDRLQVAALAGMPQSPGGGPSTGETVGKIAGTGAGWFAGARFGAAAGSFLGPVGTMAGGLLGAGVGYLAGGAIGDAIGRGVRGIIDAFD